MASKKSGSLFSLCTKMIKVHIYEIGKWRHIFIHVYTINFFSGFFPKTLLATELACHNIDHIDHDACNE